MCVPSAPPPLVAGRVTARTLTSPYLLVLAFTGVLTAALFLVAVERRAEPGAWSFAAFLSTIGVSVGLYAVALVTFDESVRLLLERLQWLTMVLVPVAWLVFVVEYTGYGEWLTPTRLVALAALPVATVVVGLVAPEPLLWTDLEYVEAGGLALVDQSLGPLFWATLLYGMALTVAASGVLLTFGLTAGHLYRDQTAAIGVGVAVPMVVSVFSAVDATPLPGLNVTTYAFAVSALAFGNAVFRYDFFEHVPAVRRLGNRAVAQYVRDGVIVVDRKGRVVEANATASDVLGRPVADLLGTRFQDALPEERVEPARFGDAALVRGVDCQGVFEVDESPVTDQYDRAVGAVYVLRDVTGRENREQRLAVLNRALRHNLRNDMNVVDGYATTLADRLDGEDAAVAETIQGVAADLVALSKKARDVETVMAAGASDDAPADVDALVERTVDAVRDAHPDASVSVTVDGAARVPSRAVVEAVVENAVENAVVHGGGRVRVRTEPPADGCVQVVVADDGPGIPESELAVVERGVETQLDHGSGLGLWVVAWGVRSLGGSVDVDAGDDGTTVTLRLPTVGDGGHGGDGGDAAR
jgi:signal transduction histidine kinase